MLESFKNAFQGIKEAVKAERNMRIHLVFAVLVIYAGFQFQIISYHWIVLLLLIGLVISAEMINSAIERVMDLLHPDQHETVRIIKDISAGAVLILSIVAVVVGLIIFTPYLSQIDSY